MTNERLIFFSQAEGSLLIRLMLAHLISDFMLQTTAMVAGKKWLSKQMMLHTAIVFALSWLLGGNLLLAAAVAFTHWMIDSLKIEFDKKNIIHKTTLFIADQILHIAVIILLWALWEHTFPALLKAVTTIISNHKTALVLLGYVLICNPVSYLIKYVTLELYTNTTQQVQHGGKLIGIFERIIILTLVLLGQYEAIGFLITGKSIIRYMGNDEHLRSEYVLVGTMMSYATAILTGAGINWLLSL